VKTKYGSGPHVGSARLAAFLVDGIALNPTEVEHVKGCRMCTQLMRIAASDELKRRRTRSFPGQVDTRMNKQPPINDSN